ncbi:MAG: DNA repair protein RecO C-terminal domain-containing protein [Pseudomonadota bacterium]
MWSDTALMLSVAKKSASELLLNLLTRSHGLRTCSLKLDRSDIQLLLPGCELEITGKISGIAGLVDVQINDVAHGVTSERNDDPAILIVRHLNETITDMVPPNEPYQSLFSASTCIVQAMEIEDPRWPIHFVHWEIALLEALGYMRRFRRCRSDYRHGEAIYISPRSGKVVSRQEAGAFLDRLRPVPSLLMGAQNGSLADVQRSLDLVTMLLEEFVCPDLGTERLWDTRDQISELINDLDHIPGVQDARKPKRIDADERKRRLSAMRRLMVGCRKFAPV